MLGDRNNSAAAAKPAAIGIPDVHATASSPALRYVDLNRQINHDYGVFGER